MGKVVGTVHYEVHRSMWNGVSTTACGLKYEKAVQAGFFQEADCPTCIAYVKNKKK